MSNDIERTIELIRASSNPPGDDELVFDAPWQARAFAIAVALAEDGAYEWSAFQRRLIDEIERTESHPEVDTESAEEQYYRQWLAALERLLVADGVVHRDELAERAQAFANGERDASEWVEGHHHGEHGHDHSHGDSHHGEHEHDHNSKRHNNGVDEPDLDHGR